MTNMAKCLLSSERMGHVGNLNTPEVVCVSFDATQVRGRVRNHLNFLPLAKIEGLRIMNLIGQFYGVLAYVLGGPHLPESTIFYWLIKPRRCNLS